MIKLNSLTIRRNLRDKLKVRIELSSDKSILSFELDEAHAERIVEVVQDQMTELSQGLADQIQTEWSIPRLLNPDFHVDKIEFNKYKNIAAAWALCNNPTLLLEYARSKEFEGIDKALWEIELVNSSVFNKRDLMRVYCSTIREHVKFKQIGPPKD